MPYNDRERVNNGAKRVPNGEYEGRTWSQNYAKWQLGMVPKPIQGDPKTSKRPSRTRFQWWDSFWMRFGAGLGGVQLGAKID